MWEGGKEVDDNYDEGRSNERRMKIMGGWGTGVGMGDDRK